MNGVKKMISVISYITMLLGCYLAGAQVPDASEESRHKVVLENEYVRVLEGRVPVRDTTLAHMHSANSVVIFLSESMFGIQNMGQKPVITKVSPGDVVYRAYGDQPVNHIVWNQSATPFHFIVVELLKADYPCLALSQPDCKLLWQNKMVASFKLDLDKNNLFRMTKTNCPFFMINISGTMITSSSGSLHTMSANDFAFFPPQSDIEIRSGKENSQGILLELK